MNNDTHPAQTSAQAEAVTEAPVALLSEDLLKRLAVYRKRESELIAKQQAKPDAVANAELKDKLRPAHGPGHIEGMRPGAILNNRGEIAILGGHTKIFNGIDYDKDGCLAIAMSGGYKDDADDGINFWYTGAGGREGKKKQVKDQSWTYAPNASLLKSHKSGGVVRVFRGRRKEGVLSYVYEGLYTVQEVKEEAGLDGPKVCKCKMVGVEGQSVASFKVEHGAMYKSAGRKSQLRFARLAQSVPQSSKRRVVQETPEALAAWRQLRVDTIAQSQHVVCADISGGKERLPVPVFNEVDDTPAPEIEYVADYVWGEGVEEQMRPILEREAAKLRAYCACKRDDCGIEYSKRMHKLDKACKLDESKITPSEPYLSDSGLLHSSEPFGIHECGKACLEVRGGGSAKCRNNMQVTNGVSLPLEVYKTASKGWGVRCAEPIKAGQFVVAYVGELITDELANKRGDGLDHYIFALKHFKINYDDAIELGGLQRAFDDVSQHKFAPPPYYDTYEDLVRAMQSAHLADGAGGSGEGGEPDEAVATAPPPPANDQSISGSGGSPLAAGAKSATAQSAPAVQLIFQPVEAADQVATAVQVVIQPGAAGQAVTAVQVAGQPGAAGQSAVAVQVAVQAPAAAMAAPSAGSGPSAKAIHALDASQHPYLAIDAMRTANLARFINHSCDGGNLTKQPVFAKSARSTLLYYIAMFASCEIPAGQELLYSYQYPAADEEVEAAIFAESGTRRRTMACNCGAANCVKVLVLGD